MGKWAVDPSRGVTSQIAFTPDGRLLALTNKGLALWPWRELIGGP